MAAGRVLEEAVGAGLADADMASVIGLLARHDQPLTTVSTTAEERRGGRNETSPMDPHLPFRR